MIMSEIDLIPSSYRDQIWKLRILKLFGFITACLILTTGVAYGALEYVTRDTNSEISKLEKIKQITSQQREALSLLKEEKRELEYQWALLNGLRTAVAAEDLFVAIDAAIQDVDVWFSSMKFQRAEVDVSDQELINTGYFIIVAPGNESQSLAIGTKMLIAGEAPNHSTLSSFVKNLLDQSEILDANVLETISSRNASSTSVKFNLAITVNLENKAS